MKSTFKIKDLFVIMKITCPIDSLGGDLPATNFSYLAEVPVFGGYEKYTCKVDDAIVFIDKSKATECAQSLKKRGYKVESLSSLIHKLQQEEEF